MEAKPDLIARKLQLKPGMRVLDIGCGWGGALAILGERYKIEGVGITVSEASASPCPRSRLIWHVKFALGCRWTFAFKTTVSSTKGFEMSACCSSDSSVIPGVEDGQGGLNDQRRTRDPSEEANP